MQHSPDTTTMLDLALSYTAKGWPVFPVRGKEEYDDITGEVYAPKTPLTSNGLKGASLNERIVREWWRRYPDAMVGVPTGSKVDAFALDIDNKPGGANGFDWLDEMEAEHGPLPHTARVKTPNGGLHIFFRYVPGTRNRGALGAGVDIRSEGGYVVAGGSVMADGRAYAWEDADAPIVDAPEWLLALVLKPKVEPSHTGATYQPGQNERYVNAAVDAELRELSSTPQGARNNALNDAAYSLGQLVGAGALARSEAEAALFSVASVWPNHKLSLGTIKRGLDAGERQPRQIPDASNDNDNTRLVDISRMIERGLAKAKAEKAGKETAQKPEPKADITEPAGDAPDDPQPEPAFHATPFKWIDPATLPRREFAYGVHYIRKYVSVTVSPGGLGKTSNSIAESLAMVSGRGLLGVKPPKRMRVWLFNAEDPRDEMERRIMAACIHFNLKPDDLERHLFLDTGREQELVIAREDKRAGVKIIEPIVEAIVSQIQANGIDVMVVDPFVSTHQVNENDNGAIDKVAKLWAQIADRTNCSIDVVHHLRKVADREATVEDARGAVALLGAARSVRVLNRMSEEQATAAGIPAEERFSYFNVHAGKVNLTKYSAAQDWRKLESVPLGNGRGLSKPQDHAGVVTEWKWPNAEEVVGELDAEQIGNIKSTLAGGGYKAAAQGKPWAGEAIAYALGLDIEDKAAKRRVASLLKALIAEGVLTIVEERDPMSRMVAKFVKGV